MRHLSMLLLLCLLFPSRQLLSQTGTFTRSVYLCGMGYVDLNQMHDTLGLNCNAPPKSRQFSWGLT